MSILSTCYGADIETLADVDGGFETVTTTTLMEFALRQWQDVAETLGFLQPLTRTIGGLANGRGGLLGLQSIALAEFETWHDEQLARSPSRVPPAVRQRRASVRRDVLLDHLHHPDRLWTIRALPSTLPHAACFDRVPAVSLSGRAFLDDSAGNYFHETTRIEAKSPCDWLGPVYLSLGTFPWVYGGRLHRTPPGLAWGRAADASPAAIAMRICASLWQPEVNLRQDARAIVFAYRYFREATDLALQTVPPYNPRTAVPGGMYRRGLLLHAEQSSAELHTFTGPLGPLAANAYNYVIRRFAAFFALRRSLLSGVARLTTEQQQAIDANPDPCLRPFVLKGLGLSAS